MVKLGIVWVIIQTTEAVAEEHGKVMGDKRLAVTTLEILDESSSA
jgi:hypothetical protein